MSDDFLKNIPTNWSVVPFDQVAEKITCGIAATPQYVDQENGMPFLSAQNVRNGRLDLTNYKYIPKALHRSLTKNTKPRAGDVLYTRVGAGIGEAAVVDTDLEFSFYVSLTLIRCGYRLDNYFLKYLLNSYYYKKLAKREQFAGGGVQNLNVQVVKKFPIPIPPLPEQRKIAEILSCWDQGIEKVERLRKVHQQYWKASIARVLADHKHELTALGEVAKLQGGYAFQSTKFSSSGIPIVRISNIVNDRVSLEEDVVFYQDEEVSPQFKVYRGDILIAMSGATTGKIGRYSEENFAYLNQRVGKFVITDSSALSSEYLFQIVRTALFRQQLGNLLLAGAQPNISGDDIEGIKIPLLPLPTQEKVADCFRFMDQVSSTLSSLAVAMRSQKQSLMRSLLTGKIRVKV